jgi:hypothetical protein
VSISYSEEHKQILYSGTDFAEPTQFDHVFRVFQQTAFLSGAAIPPMKLSISYVDVQTSGNKETATGNVKTGLGAVEKQKVIVSPGMQT